MNNSLDASIFSFSDGYHEMYLEEAMTMLSSAYIEVAKKIKYDQSGYNENKLRDDLVRLTPPKRPGMYLSFDTESRNLELNNVRIDITILTLEVLCQPTNDFEKRITIECKIIGVNEYINRNGIISYVEGKYASQLSVAGMIGFIIDDTPEGVRQKINSKLKKHTEIETIIYLEHHPISNGFPHSYRSQHKRQNLDPIDLRHLLLDYAATIN